MIVNMMVKARLMMSRISKGINHDSIIVVVELFMNFIDGMYNVTFTFFKNEEIKRRCIILLSAETVMRT